MILATKNNIFHDFKSMRSILDIVNDKVQSTTNKCITFFDYMNLVLYDSQQGYYGSGNVNIGSEGDFFTSSSLGPDFGELLAEQFKEMGYTAQKWFFRHGPMSGYEGIKKNGVGGEK